MLYINNKTSCTLVHITSIQVQRLTRQRLRGCSSSSSSWRLYSVMTYTLSPSLTTLESSPDIMLPASLEPFLDELPLILRSIDRDLKWSVYVKPEFRIYFSNFRCFKTMLLKEKFNEYIYNCCPYHTKLLCRIE